MKKQPARNVVMMLAIIVTLGLVYWVNQQDQPTDDGSLPLALKTARAPSSRPLVDESTVTNPLTQLNWRLLDGRKLGMASDHKSIDLFKTHSWFVAPAPTLAKNLPPPAPMAPTAPFSYLGHIEGTTQGTLIFLSSGDKLYTVMAGSDIDKLWRLDSEDSNFLRLTYLPLNLPQTISKKSKSPGIDQPITPEQQQGSSS